MIERRSLVNNNNNNNDNNINNNDNNIKKNNNNNDNVIATVEVNDNRALRANGVFAPGRNGTRSERRPAVPGGFRTGRQQHTPAERCYDTRRARQTHVVATPLDAYGVGRKI